MHHVSIAAVHCGASHVAFGLFSGGRGRLLLDAFATEPLDRCDLTEERWLDAAAAAIRRILRGKRLRARCVVGLPGHLAFAHSFRVPQVTARQRRRIIAFEKRRGVAAAEEMFSIEVPACADERGGEIMLAVAKRRLIEGLGARMIEAGLYPEAAVPAWLVLRHAIGCRPERTGGALALSVGARSSQLVFRLPGGFSARTIAVGGGEVTRMISDELGIDHAAAEALKLMGVEGAAVSQVAERERAAVRIAFDRFVRLLGDEILRALQPAQPPGEAGSPPVLLLTGGGARPREFPGALAERLQLRVERLELRSCIAFSPGAADPAAGPDDAALADLVGLAACAFDGARREGNLLPRPFRHEMFVRRRGRRLAVAALAAILAGLLPPARLWTQVSDIRRRTAAAEASISGLRRIDARNRSNLTRLADTDRRIGALRRLSRARSGWISLFGDLQATLADVQDVWLDGLQVIDPAAHESPAPPAATAAVAEAAPPDASAAQPDAAAGPRLLISGRMLDPGGLAAAGAGAGQVNRTELLLSALRASPRVGAVERGQFSGARPGVVSFEIILRLAPDALP